MNISFLGGADEVGGSSILFEIAGKRILVDAGIRPSPRARLGLAGDQLPHLSQVELGGGLDAVLVTHAHTDHTGALELVAERFPGVPFYATPMTIALTRILHQDSRRIMQTRLDEEGELPLFDDVSVSRLFEAFTPAQFNERLPLAGGISAVFCPAGHIAGAAMVSLQSDEGHVLISGDISISAQRTVDGARIPPIHPDILILESTYGGRLHANRAAQEKQLVKAVSDVVDAGGKVLIPAFALGRAQELLLILGEARRRGEFPAVPVWADGMVRAICQAYSLYPESLPLPLQERGATFFDEHIHPVDSAAQRNALVWQDDSVVIIASSGMLAGGPSLSYARMLATKPQHAIFLTGYQDEEAPGRRLQEVAARGSGAIRLGKDKVDVQCRLATYSLSAHADEAQLVSLAETLDPEEIVLVHGDEAARASLERSLRARQRHVQLPHAGQVLDYHFTRRSLPRTLNLGVGRRLDCVTLWKEFAAPGGGAFYLDELSKAWWGDVTETHKNELRLALAADDLYFVADPSQTDLYRARSSEQVERSRQRREKLASFPALTGKWLAFRQPGGETVAGRCLDIAADFIRVEPPGEAPHPVWPEDILAVYGDEQPGSAAIAVLGDAGKQPQRVMMEPNQALALTNQFFPPEARLRRSGYRLEQHTLLLSFDFPDAAREKYCNDIERLAQATGWQVEVSPEANHEALNILARSLFPAGWKIIKGPAIYRDKKSLGLTVAAPSLDEYKSLIRELEERFYSTSGYELVCTFTLLEAKPASLSLPVDFSGRWEINAACTAIKDALEGSTLYRTSLKGEEIVLSFISLQVGMRYQTQIAALAQKVGWPLSINPQPNQGQILETVRKILEEVGWPVQKGPGLYPERAEVEVTLSVVVEESKLESVSEMVDRATGYRLNIHQPVPAAPRMSVESKKPEGAVVDIPTRRIRLSRYQQSVVLDEAKIVKAIERFRRLGQIIPPVKVRRLQDGYLLLDGLYRLRAAVELGLEKIPAEIE